MLNLHVLSSAPKRYRFFLVIALSFDFGWGSSFLSHVSFNLFIHLFLFLKIEQIPIFGFIFLKDPKELSGWIQRVSSWAGVNQHHPTEADFRQTTV